MSGIMPGMDPVGPVSRRDRRAAYRPGTAKKTGLDSRFTVSVAWRPNETSHAGIGCCCPDRST